MLSGTESLPVHWTTGLEWFADTSGLFRMLYGPEMRPGTPSALADPE